MSNLESIENYLTNKLSEQEKNAFEQQMLADPALKADLDLQKHIVEGVRRARATELKAMLSNVPVPTGGTLTQLALGKIAAGVVAVGVIGTSLYFYLNSEEKQTPSPTNSTVIEEKLPASKQEKEIETPKTESQPESSPVSTIPADQKPESIDKKVPEKIKNAPAQPKIEVIDPSDELVDNPSKEEVVTDHKKSDIVASHIAVDTDDSNRKYSFHYQFSNSKLVLYGSFDKSLYEILEINGQTKTVFLFYKGNYYLLDEKQNHVTPLEPIKEGNLLRKLKEYRSR
jgi:hypothetical protein